MKDKLLFSLPSLSDRQTMLSVLYENEYGIMPKHTDISFNPLCVSSRYKNLFGGKANYEKVDITVDFDKKSFTFPVEIFRPAKEGKHPFFVYISFKTALSSVYAPIEEIIDGGFGIAKITYTDITSDDGDFTNGLAGVIYDDGKRNNTDAGKIAMWAFAASRTVDLLETKDYVDTGKISVCGHSRLGKTALLAAAIDERFFCAHSNDSGCSGAALARENKGETVAKITQNFPFWFCENYYKYADNENQMPFDQHFLISSIAPRYVYVSSADEDLWADPENEFLACVASSSAFKNGFVCEGQIPTAVTKFHQGDIGYHIRKGRHYHSREDWQYAMEFIKSKF